MNGGKLEAGSDLVVTITDRLRQQIVSGLLQPGARLFEAQIARSLGVSRAPVREAARLLEREGLLISQANRGFSVRSVTLRELVELTDFRTCIECYAIRTVVKSPKLPQLIGSLEIALVDILEHYKSGDRSGQVASDFRFHRLIVEHAGNRRLLTAFDQIAIELRIAMRLMGFATADWGTLAKSHEDIIAVLRKGVASTAEKAIGQHIHFAWDETVEQLRARADVPLTAVATPGFVQGAG